MAAYAILVEDGSDVFGKGRRRERRRNKSATDQYDTHECTPSHYLFSSAPTASLLQAPASEQELQRHLNLAVRLDGLRDRARVAGVHRRIGLSDMRSIKGIEELRPKL